MFFLYPLRLKKIKFMGTNQKTARIIAHPAALDAISKNHKAIFVKPYTTSELVELYGVNEKTFRKWLRPFNEEIGRKNGAYFTCRQVKVIFDKLDVPHYYEVA